MYETLFHPAIWMPVAVLLVGVAVFIYGNARVQSGVRAAGAGVVALAIVWYAVASFVQTPIEQCLTRTKSIVSAVEGGRWDEFKKLIDKSTVIERINARGPEAVSATVQGSADGYGLKAIHTLNTDVTTGPGTYDVTISTLLEGSQATNARFMFQYEQRTDGILLTRLVPLSVGNLSVDDLTNYIRNKAGAFGR